MPSECTAIQCSSDLRRARFSAGLTVVGTGAVAVVMVQSPEPIRPPRRRMSRAVKAMESAKSTSATTQAAP
ncbi:hypothetical protein GCM10010222_23260 [Streptomyces tanashiensis]|nr:hypothetical protein GCM10010222_23260 [Streptomyces tanashiensis]